MGLKILHTADWHLDSPFLSFPQEQRDLLWREQRKLPDKIAALCRREGCDLVLIAGDIFDGEYTYETLHRVQDALEDCGVPVFITPGNHDFVGKGSPWTEEQWPDNVHIFTSDLKYVDLPRLNCRVYGAGFTSMDCPPLLNGFEAEGAGYRIAVLHGDATRVNSPYCAVTAAQVEQSRLHYLALGHIHKPGGFQAGDTLCAWPGCPMGRGWDETGEKGVCIVTLGEQAEIRMVELDTVRFHEMDVEVKGNAMAALNAVLPVTESRDFFRITLTGTGSADLERLYEAFANIPNLELRDRTLAPVDPWEDADADSLRGLYFKMLRDAMEAAEPEEAARIRLAAEISKQLLEGREVTLP